MATPIYCTWNDMQLVVERITDSVGHDWVQHRYPGRDGAEVESMGRKPRDFRMDIVFFGDAWIADTWIFLSMVEVPFGAAGIFTHPWWGSMSAIIDQVDVTHVDKQRGGAKLSVHVVEATVTPFAFSASSTLPSAAASATATIDAASAAVAALELP